jgi:hypothetical protein
MRCCGERPHGLRARGLIVVLWRAACASKRRSICPSSIFDPRRGSVLVRRGKGGHRREVGMDDWGFEQLGPWLRRPPGAAGRAAVLRDQRPHLRSRVAIVGRSRGSEAPRGTPDRTAAYFVEKEHKFGAGGRLALLVQSSSGSHVAAGCNRRTLLRARGRRAGRAVRR